MGMFNNNILLECASLNNLGVKYEKENKIDAAIKVYEDNIRLGYPATHSYERLMILYRKRKEYSKEIKVIEKAIEVFTRENMRRANIAIRDYPKMELKIKKALDMCQMVKITRNGNPWVIFNPYDVAKYKRRLFKATELHKNITSK